MKNLPRTDLLRLAAALLCIAALAGCVTTDRGVSRGTAAPPADIAPAEALPAEAAPADIAPAEAPPAEAPPAEPPPAEPPPTEAPPAPAPEPPKEEPLKLDSRHVRITNLDTNEIEVQKNCDRCGTTAFDFVNERLAAGTYPAKGYKFEIIDNSNVIYKGTYVADKNKRLVFKEIK